jgi:hypothetical protein
MFTLPAVLLIVALTALPAAAEDASEADKPKKGTGVTLQDLGRGLKNAAKNVEQEIPKIGPAIVDTVKKLSGKESDKPPAQNPEQQK